MTIENNPKNVKIDLSVLKKGFKEYLEDKTIVEPDKVQNKSASIFLNSEEFKNYLVEEIGLDKSIFSQDINSLMKGIQDGSLLNENKDVIDKDAAENLKNLEEEQKLLENEDSISFEDEEDGSESENEIKADEGEEVSSDTETNKDDSFMAQALSEALSDSEVINCFDSDKDGELSAEEIEEFLSGANLDKDIKELTFDELSKIVQGIYGVEDSEYNEQLLDKVFDDEDVINVIDLDNDGKLSDEEKAKFREFITGYTSGGDKLTLDDIKNSFNDILNDRFDYTSVKKEAGLELDEDDVFVNDDTQGEKTYASPSGGVGGGGYSGGSGGNYSNWSNSSNPVDSNDPNNMSLEQLEALKVEKQTAVDEAQKEVDDINSGEKFKEQEASVLELEEAYKEALDNEKDSEAATQIKKYITDINTKESEIQETETSISDLSKKEQESNNTLNATETTLSALKSTQSELNSAQSDDPNKQSEITQKKQDIAKKIEELEAQYNEQKAALQGIQEDKKEKEGLLTTKKGELETLKADKEKFETENKDKLSKETQEAMDAYNEAKAKLDSDKTQAKTEAQDKLTTAQGELQEINDKINEKKAQETAKEYKVQNTTLPDNVVSALDSKLGSGFSEKLEGICERLQCEPEALLGLMYSESGLTTTAVNSSSGATGLIQWLPSTAKSLGTTTSALRQMSGVQQLDYVEKYLQNCKSTYYGSGEMSAGDLYSLVWLPAYAKRDVLSSRGDKYYSSGLDVNQDGRCTKEDLSMRIQNKYNEWKHSAGIA